MPGSLSCLEAKRPEHLYGCGHAGAQTRPLRGRMAGPALRRPLPMPVGHYIGEARMADAYLVGVVKVTAKWQCLGEIANMTQHFFKDVPASLLSAGDRATLQNHVQVWWLTGHGGTTVAQKTLHPSVVTYIGCDITEYTTATSGGDPITNTESESDAATGGSGTLPPQVSICLTKLTGASGASARGRAYLPFISSLALEPSLFVIDPSTQVAHGHNWAQLLNAINIGSVPVTAHVFSHKQSVSRAVTAIRTGSLFDTMRSRKNALVETFVSSPV